MALPAPNTVQAVTPTPVKSNSADKSRVDAFKAEGASIRAGLTEEQKALEGSMSEQVAFVACLGNPDKPGKRKEGALDVPTYEVVGYKFKLLADMDIPRSALKGNDPCSCDTIEWVPAHAGDVVNLTIMEAAALATKVEFSGKFTGEGQEIVFAVKISASNNGQPRPYFKRKEKPSIKVDMDLIADVTTNEAGKNTSVIKEEYAEKFSSLFQKRTSTRAGQSKKKVDDGCKNLSAAFRQYLSQKTV